MSSLFQFSDDLPIAVFDVETTGLSPEYGDRICEVGLVCARGDSVLETYQTLVNPQRPISPGAARVNGLSDEMVADAPTFAGVAAQVLRRIDGAALVCHNAPFDTSFLSAELARLGLRAAPAGVIDTLDLARRHFHFPSNSLSAVARQLGIVNVQAHRALGDALTTFHVFRAFYHTLQARGSAPIAASAPPSRAPGAAAHPALLPPAIQAALEQNQTVEIIYLDGEGARTCRRITPRQALAVNGVVRLVAFCHLRQAERSFRLDRIVAVEGVFLQAEND